MGFFSYSTQSKGSELVKIETNNRELTPFDCKIQVQTCGICHSDIHMIDNDWRISKFPLVAGHEIVGKIVELGSSVKHLKNGDRVGVGWQSGACMQCEDCVSGNENLCDTNEGTIVGRNGGFAEYVTVDSRFAFPIPDGLESAIASPLLCGGITVYSALKYAGMKYGGRIGVIGIGGLGHMAVLFAKKLGNRVTAFTTSEDKAEFAKELGADEVLVNPKSRDRVSKGLDIILNTTHNDLDWTYYTKQLGSDGTLSFVGVPPSSLNLSVGALLSKRKRIMASPIGGRKDIYEMLDLAADYRIFPVIEKFPIDRINEAIQKVRDNKIRYRAVLEF